MISLPLPLNLPPAVHSAPPPLYFLGLLSALPLCCGAQSFSVLGVVLSMVLPVWLLVFLWLGCAAANGIHMAFKLMITFCWWNSLFSPPSSHPCHRSRSPSCVLNRFMTVLVAADVKFWVLWVFIHSNRRLQVYWTCALKKRKRMEQQSRWAPSCRRKCVHSDCVLVAWLSCKAVCTRHNERLSKPFSCSVWSAVYCSC